MQNAQPVYDKLLESGALLAWGVDVQYIHTADPGYRKVWYVVPDLDAAAKVDAALEEMFTTDGAALQSAVAAVGDFSKHRDSLGKIIHYAIK